MTVRAILLMVLGLAAFAAAMLLPHRQAVRLRALEDPIPHELSARASSGFAAPAEALGYRFTWMEPGEHPAVLLAGPIELGETGVRWFATRDGREVFEFDPTLYALGSTGPPTHDLQKFLSLSVRERSKNAPIFGWKPLR